MLDMIRGFFRTRLTREQKVALVLYEQIVSAARAPVLYSKAGIPDTLEGRVESIALHAFLLFRRMSGQPGWEEIGGALSDEIVADFDRSLREMGVGDMSIGKKVKKLAQRFFARFDSYWGAVKGAEGAEDLASLMRWTVFQDRPVGESRIDAMVDYFDAQSKHLFALDAKAILIGRVSFLDPAPLMGHLPEYGVQASESESMETVT